MITKKSLPLNDEELEAYEATRDLYMELKQSAKDLRAGLGRVVFSPLISARNKTGLSQAEFAEMLGISPAILEDIEQQRIKPDAAVGVLIEAAIHHPQDFLNAARTRIDNAIQK